MAKCNVYITEMTRVTFSVVHLCNEMDALCTSNSKMLFLDVPLIEHIVFGQKLHFFFLPTQAKDII